MSPVGRYLDEATNRYFAYFKHHLGLVRPHGQRYEMPLPSDRFVRVVVNGRCEIFFPYNDQNMRNAYLTFVLLNYDLGATIALLKENFPNIPDQNGMTTPEEDRRMQIL
jgi:hypothetical protein